jgi:hypothetical protein
MIGAGINESIVKRIMGHTTVQMLDRYVAFDAQSLMQAAR